MLKLRNLLALAVLGAWGSTGWGADVAISALPPGTTLGGTEPMPAVQSSVTVRVTPTQLATYVLGTPLTSSVILGKFTGTCSSVTLLHGAGGCGAVVLTTDVSGRLPFANLVQGSALSVAGVTGNAPADFASIAAATDGNVLRRSGTALAFGSLDLTAAGTVGSSILGSANGGTGNAFTAFSGPSGTLKTYTLPNSSTTILTSAAAVTVAQGGTGIASGTSGGVPYFASGSTMASSAALTQYGVMLGGGAGGSPTTVSGTGTSGYVLTSTGAAAPTWQPSAGGGITVQTITATATISNSNRLVLCNAAGGAITVNLGAAATYQNIIVKKIDSTANACTVDPNSTETVDGGGTAVISVQYASISLGSDGSNWWIY